MEPNIVAVDLGGTLSKVAVFCSQNLEINVPFQLSDIKVDCIEISHQEPSKNYKLIISLITFAKIDEFFNFLQTKIFESFDDLKIIATGGGALKYQQKFKQMLQKSHQKGKKFEFKVQMNEFETIISSIQLLIDCNAKILLRKGQNTINNLVAQGKKLQNEIKHHPSNLQVPLILANIGSGMSVLKLQLNKQSKLEFARIGGSALGGGFFFGLQKIVNHNFEFQKLTSNSLTEQELDIMKPCIQNLSQIITLYSDIHQINRILITGGMAKAEVIKNEFIQNLSNKQIFFTQIDGLLSVVGMVLSQWKKIYLK